MKRRSEQAVALIVTLILLAAITFMAITFLAISRRERGAVATVTDQATAKMAADAALARAEAQIVASMLASNNPYSSGLLVSTNFINWGGFTAALPAGADPYTNVNYQYANGNPLNQNDLLQNLANLRYDPRPPVFVTNRSAGTTDFRYYLDLNRNGVYDTNGYWPEIGTNGLPITTVSNGVIVTNFSFFVGDPEWIGMLERPDLPHSAVNQFQSRFAFIAIPAGNTLDLNYIHNHAKQQTPLTRDGFYRNQGVGSWELNLAGFLVDLNTNFWEAPPYQPYFYNTSSNTPSTGTAFDDAFYLTQWRYNGNYLTSLKSVATSFGLPGVNAFGADMIDGYSGGPLMTDFRGWNAAPDADAARTGKSWPGADNLTHYFTTQELFDRNKTAAGASGQVFSDRLQMAGTNNWPNTSSYDRYTFYRLLSQLGTESAPDSPGKMNLNYDNLVQRNPLTGAVSATNFYEWQPLAFFTNAADRLLRAQFGFGVTRIPVYTNNTFVYTPSMHRMLQLAANIYDAIYYTNIDHYSGIPGIYFPSVFCPEFQQLGNNVYITGFVEITNISQLSGFSQRDLTDTNALSTPLQPNSLVFGVPLVIGAKKGLPNFNEFSMQSISQISRRLRIGRQSLDAPISLWQTNQMFIVGISNVLGVELWNSYRANYTRPVTIQVSDFLSMTLTNDHGYKASLTPTSPLGMLISTQMTVNPWPGYSGQNIGVDPSFRVPLLTNILFQPDAVYWYNHNQLYANLATSYESGAENLFPQPQWGLGITNHLLCYMMDGGRIIDYVQLNGMSDHRDLLGEIATNDVIGLGYNGLWATNRQHHTASLSDMPLGVINQIQVSLGNYQSSVPPAAWFAYNTAGAPLTDLEIANFRAFFSTSHKSVYNGLTGNNTNLLQDVPFVPAKRMSKYWTWQANDPLVHYTSGDLLYLDQGTNAAELLINAPIHTLENIGQVNRRYQPWGGSPINPDPETAYVITLKDPLVTRSDDWQFPTNKLPTIGWLGRVHRGTPWQTVYLKSLNILAGADGLTTWQKWTGNSIVATNGAADAQRTTPVQDELIFDLFTTAFNDNASRGQLSINQSGLAAWSAVFDGVVVITNSIIPGTNGWTTIDPAGVNGANSALWQLVNGTNGINATRTNSTFNGAFKHLGDILAVPALTDQSPFLNQTTTAQMHNGLNDAVYEWLPQQVMSLLRLGTQRYVIYSYGQTLRPAPNSIYTGGGAFLGICTNYQITAETATRSVIRVDGSPDPKNANNPDPSLHYPPHIVVESFNVLPPD